MRPDYIHVAVTTTSDEFAVVTFVMTEYTVDGSVRWTREPTDENIVKLIFRAGLRPKSWRIIESYDIPADREYRGAWKDDGDKIYHDINVAKKIHMERLRSDRAKIMEKLDVEWMKAMSMSDTKTIDEINRKKQITNGIVQTTY